MIIDTVSIIKRLKPLDPEKIILFGSIVKRQTTTDSDIDLLVIKQTNKRPSERVSEVLKLVWGYVPHIEPQVLTPEEFEQAIADNRFFITQEVLKYGRTIYEKKT